MIRDHEQADSALADALWWLKGFAAAAPNEHASDTAAGMADSLREIRQWLGSLSLGDKRLLGTNERCFAVVLTEHEYEVLVDGLRSDRSSEDHAQAANYAAKITNQLNEERKRFVDDRNPEVPF